MKYLKLFFIILFLIFAVTCNNVPVITGCIFDYETGKPVEGAVVKFYHDCEHSRCSEKYGSVITDEMGRYKIMITERVKIIGEKCYIEVRKDGYVTLQDYFNIVKDNKLSIYLKEISS
jgi:hypothetical protein